MRSNRILLTAFGSLGDLHPSLAIASELRRRGHRPVVGTIERYRSNVESAGLEFRLIRTALVETSDRELMHEALNEKGGAEYIVRKLLMPGLRVALADTMAAAEGMSLLVAHPMTLSTRLVSEMTGIPWVSTQLAPMGFLSAYDPPVIPIAPFLASLVSLGPIFFRPLLALARRSVRPWTEPYRKFRRELALPSAGDPLFEGSHAPSLVLALFSSLLGKKQVDWPEQAVVTGFPFFDGAAGKGLPPELQQFLDEGDPPIVFTLGTAAVMDAGRFYQESAAAAGLLRRRAILLVGSDPANRPPVLPDGVACFDYAPYSLLFPHAAAIVHQGGVGTTGQAMRAGKPMLVMPYAIDQPDNAARARRLGIARVVRRSDYIAERAALDLRKLLGDSAYVNQSKAVAEEIAREQGDIVGCDCLEDVLARLG